MDNLPSPENPFQLLVTNPQKPFSVPALKNRKTIRYRGRGKPYVGTNIDVENFLTVNQDILRNLYEEQEFTTVPTPLRLTGWSFIKVYATDPNVLPKNDVDNQFATIQECLMPHVVQSDSQVEGFWTQRIHTLNKEAQMGVMWLWVTDERHFLFEEVAKFYTANKQMVMGYIQMSPFYLNAQAPASLKSLLNDLL